MKRIYYLAGLPRTGNTLLSSILNQNPKIHMTPNSMLCQMAWNIYQIKETTIFKNFPDHETIDNVIKKIFEHYHDSTNAEIIFDRGPWGRPLNLKMIKKYINPNPKFLILDRPIIEIIASFLRAKKDGDANEIVRTLMNKENGKLYQDIVSARNIFKSNEKYQKIEYDDLVNNTKDVVDEIYSYFEIPKYEHDFSKLSQLTFNNIGYDDSVLNFDLHTIRTNIIKKEEIDLKDFFNEEEIERLKKYNIYA